MRSELNGSIGKPTSSKAEVEALQAEQLHPTPVTHGSNPTIGKLAIFNSIEQKMPIKKKMLDKL